MDKERIEWVALGITMLATYFIVFFWAANITFKRILRFFLMMGLIGVYSYYLW